MRMESATTRMIRSLSVSQSRSRTSRTRLEPAAIRKRIMNRPPRPRDYASRYAADSKPPPWRPHPFAPSPRMTTKEWTTSGPQDLVPSNNMLKVESQARCDALCDGRAVNAFLPMPPPRNNGKQSRPPCTTPFRFAIDFRAISKRKIGKRHLNYLNGK